MNAKVLPLNKLRAELAQLGWKRDINSIAKEPFLSSTQGFECWSNGLVGNKKRLIIFRSTTWIYQEEYEHHIEIAKKYKNK